MCKSAIAVAVAPRVQLPDNPIPTKRGEGESKERLENMVGFVMHRDLVVRVKVPQEYGNYGP
jgi:hypothetical protein